MTCVSKSILSRRSVLASVLLVGLLPTATFGADKPKTINIDWATYNPVSMLLKEKGLLEKEFAKDGIGIRWVQTLGSNKALEFLNAGSIDFGSTAGSAALRRQDQRQPDQVDLCLFAVRSGRRWSPPRIRRSPRSRTSRASASR